MVLLTYWYSCQLLGSFWPGLLVQCWASLLAFGMPFRVSIFGITVWPATSHVLHSTGSTMPHRHFWYFSAFFIRCSCSQVQVSSVEWGSQHQCRKFFLTWFCMTKFSAFPFNDVHILHLMVKFCCDYSNYYTFNYWLFSHIHTSPDSSERCG